MAEEGGGGEEGRRRAGDGEEMRESGQAETHRAVVGKQQTDVALVVCGAIDGYEKQRGCGRGEQMQSDDCPNSPPLSSLNHRLLS